MTFDFTPKNLFNMTHLRFRRLWLAIGLLMVAAVTGASLVQLPQEMVRFLLQDKLMHLLAYAGLMGWFAQLFRHDLTRLLLVFAFCGLGIWVEFLQAATPHRHFDLLDMLANSCGVLLAWALAYTWVGTILARFESLFEKRAV